MPEFGEENRVRPARGFFTFVVLAGVMLAVLAVLDRAGAPRAVAELALSGLAFIAFAAAGLIARTLLFSRFAYADRSLGAPWNGMALAMSAFSGVLLFAFTGPGLALGPHLMALLLAPAAGIVVGGLAIAPQLKKLGAVTAPGLLCARFQRPWLGWIAALVLVFASFAFLIAEFGVLARLAPRYLHLGADAAIGLAAIAMLVALILGGLRGITVAGAVALVVTAAAVLVPASSALISAAPFDLPAPPFADAWEAFSRQGGGMGRLPLAALLISIAAGTAAMPALSLRAGTAADLTGARSAFAFGLACLALLFWALPVHAAFGHVFAAAGNSGMAMTAHMTPVLDALFGAGVMAAALASAASLAFGAALLLVGDIYVALLDRAASPGRRLVLTRVILMVVVLAAAWLAQRGGDPFRMASVGLSLAASILPAVILALIPGLGAGAALASLLAGPAVTLVALLAGWNWTALAVERLAMSPVAAADPSLGAGWFGISPYAAGFFGLLAGLLAGAIVAAAQAAWRRHSAVAPGAA